MEDSLEAASACMHRKEEVGGRKEGHPVGRGRQRGAAWCRWSAQCSQVQRRRETPRQRYGAKRPERLEAWEASLRSWTLREDDGESQLLGCERCHHMGRCGSHEEEGAPGGGLWSGRTDTRERTGRPWGGRSTAGNRLDGWERERAGGSSGEKAARGASRAGGCLHFRSEGGAEGGGRLGAEAG